MHSRNNLITVFKQTNEKSVIFLAGGQYEYENLKCSGKKTIKPYKIYPFIKFIINILF